MKALQLFCLFVLATAVPCVAHSQPVGIFTDVRPLDESLGLAPNTAARDFAPNISCDGLTVYIRADHGPGHLGNLDNYVATRSTTSEPFGELTNLGAPVNSASRDGGLTYTEDQLELYFNSERPDPEGLGGRDIYVARRADLDAPFVVENLGAAINSSANDNGPSISKDGLTLYFHSWRTSPIKMYKATRANRDDPFGEAVLLPPPLNDPDDLDGGCCPSFSADRLAVVFNSSRFGTTGTADLWMATRSAVNQDFDQVFNLHELNSTARDRYAKISCDWPAEGSLIYFSSERPGGKGNIDIYQATWLNHTPQASFTVSPKTGADPLEVEVDASASYVQEDYSIVSYDWDFGDGNTAQGKIVDHTYERGGLYTIRLTITTDDRELSDEATQDLTVHLTPGDPSPWTSEDIGAPAVSGGARSDGECLLVAGGGKGLTGTSDEFHFLHQKVSGDFTLTTHFSDWRAENTSRLALTVREGLDPSARHGSMSLRKLSTGLRHQFVTRESPEATTAFTSHLAYGDSNLWLRIERRGDTVLGTLSEDGETWTEPDSLKLENLPAEVYVGVASSTSSSITVPSFATLCPLTIEQIPPQFSRGDCNGDGMFDISDGVSNLNSLFGDGKPSDCVEACNANDDALNDVSDAVYVFNFLFADGAAPGAPFPDCGVDPASGATLGCERRGCE